MARKLLPFIFWWFCVCLSSVKCQQNDSDENKKPQIGNGRVVVADAVFTSNSKYVGVVRFVQSASKDNNGGYKTMVTASLKHSGNSDQTIKHMWHVEHDAVSTPSTCADANPHFNPYGFMKSWNNYTTFCGASTPDYCYMGDLSSKSATLVKVGGSPETHTASLVPLVGPNSIIGHSLNIHAPNMQGQRIACANIRLNTRLTTWQKLIDVAVKTPATFPYQMYDVRSAISFGLGVAMEYVHSYMRLDTLQTDSCTTITFLILDEIKPEKVNFINNLENGKANLGVFSPVGCTVNGEVVTSVPSPPANRSSAAISLSRANLVAMATLALIAQFF